MIIKFSKPYQSTVQILNVVPFVDVLFQLIIFFALIYKVAEMENFPVIVPDSCKFAQKQEQVQPGAMTVTVMKTSQGRVEFAVGSEKIPVSDYETIPQKLAQLIDGRMKDVPTNERLVTLRVDKNVDYRHAQCALAGIAESSAADIKLAVFKDKGGGEE